MGRRSVPRLRRHAGSLRRHRRSRRSRRAALGSAGAALAAVEGRALDSLRRRWRRQQPRRRLRHARTRGVDDWHLRRAAPDVDNLHGATRPVRTLALLARPPPRRRRRRAQQRRQLRGLDAPDPRHARHSERRGAARAPPARRARPDGTAVPRGRTQPRLPRGDRRGDCRPPSRHDARRDPARRARSDRLPLLRSDRRPGVGVPREPPRRDRDGADGLARVAADSRRRARPSPGAAARRGADQPRRGDRRLRAARSRDASPRAAHRARLPHRRLC